MPKVLRILNRFVIGGPAIHVLNLAEMTLPEFETLLIVGNRDAEEGSADFLIEGENKPIYIPEMSRAVNIFQDLKAFGKIRKIIREFKPDIVDTHGSKAGAIGRLAAISMNVPVVIHTYHGHIFKSYFGKFKSFLFLQIERFLAKWTDAIIAISASQKRELVKDFKIAPAEKVHLKPLSIDLFKFQENILEKRKLFRDEFCLDEDTVAIGIIGRLVPIKNHQLFLQAISFILKKSNTKIKAFIIGDGAIRSSLELSAKTLNISYSNLMNYDPIQTDLLFTSWRKDIDVVMAGLDIVTSSSLNEGTPISLIEAQASKKPIVATKVGGIEDIVKHNITGLLSSIHEPDLYMNNLLKIVDEKDLRNELGQESDVHIIKMYDNKNIAKEMVDLYYSLLQKKGSSN